MNQLTKDLEILFEEYVEGFEAACVVSKNAKIFRPDDKTMQRAGDVIHRPQRYHMDIVEGLDVSSAAQTELVQRQVPAAYKAPQNVLWTLDAYEMRDDEHKKEAGRAAGQRLAAQIDLDLVTQATLRATNFVGVGDNSTGTLGRDLWDGIADADANFTMIGVPMGITKRAFLNARDYKNIAGELAGRSYTSGINQTAFEKAKIPDVASFDSYKVDQSGRIPTGTTTALTLAAAPAHTVEAMDPVSNLPIDNRQGVITVSGAGLQVGDAFTIEGVDMVHLIGKETTDQPQVFRVLGVSGTSVTISPKILPLNNADQKSRAYANVQANAASGAAITVLNKRATATNLLWADGSVELMYGKLAFPTGQGPQVMTATTEQGAYLIMSYAFDHLKGETTCRFTTLYGANVLVPEYVAVVATNQIVVP